MSNPKRPIPPGEGERRAQRGYVRQYSEAAAAIYAALERDDLNWVGVADRGAGVADDIVLGLRGRVVGHQFKTSKYSSSFRLKTLLLGADGLLVPLASAWRELKNSFPHDTVEIWLVTNDYPSSDDALVGGPESHSAAFLRELDSDPSRKLADWRASKWQPFADELAMSSGFDDQEFEEFLIGLRIVSGVAADFVQAHRLSAEGKRLSGEIASLLPRLVADARDRDRWTRAELLDELSWRDSFLLRRSHQFPVGAHVQRNLATENALRTAIDGADSGYIALIGPPGSGKSTLLQSSLATRPNLIAVRYLAFVPGEGQGVGRGEAEAFLDDLNAQLKRSGLVGRFRDTTLHERREQFENLLRLAGERFRNDGIRTLIVVDGLDHIPREERPERSLLAELPLPIAIPKGVLIVLGTQRLDLADVKPAVQEQASHPQRKVVVDPLSREAVYRMSDAVGLDSELRQPIFELSHGHPLVTRYLIEALRGADTARQKALLEGEISFEGDVETIYTSAWRAIEDDHDARDVLGYIAHAEGSIQPELLAQAISAQAIERALKSTRHLLRFDAQGWSVFHNSFRLFILSKPRLRFGNPDPDYSPTVYRRLADLARSADARNHQRWLELRYFARAREFKRVIELAQLARFREQLSDGRASSDIQADIKLAFVAAKSIRDAVTIFRLLLARDEIQRRATALGYAPRVVDALLAIGDLDHAQAHAEANEGGGYKVVDALLNAGLIERARALFDQIEPLARLLGGSTNDYQEEGKLTEWAKRVFQFREPDQISEALDRISKSDRARHGSQGDSSIGESLRFAIARAALAAQPSGDIDEVMRQLKIDDSAIPYFCIEKAARARELGDDISARANISRAVNHGAFPKMENSWRRGAALIAAALGDLVVARNIFSGLKAPAIAAMDGEIGDDVAEGVARAVIDHVELSTLLGEPQAEVLPSKRSVLQPLQLHATRIGVALGHIRAGRSIPQGDVVRIAREALAYLERAKPGGADEYYAMHQIAASVPVLQTAILRAAAKCGESEFARVISEFDDSFSRPAGKFKSYAKLRREFVLEFYRWSGDMEGACRRLAPLASEIRESTPEAQIEEMAGLAVTYARVGDLTQAKDLLRRLHVESLGNALAPKKDPQYVLWRELLERANAADPARRRERVVLMMRQLDGMMETEGRDSAYRIATTILSEAARVDAATALAATRAMAARALLSWAGLVSALLSGVVRRRADFAGKSAVTWASLALPYYSEPYHRPDHVGEIIPIILAAANQSDVNFIVEMLRAAIEAESHLDVRAPLLERLVAGASHRQLESAHLNEALTRWRSEAPNKRDGSTPGRYDDVMSLEELKDRFQVENKELDYEGVAAYTRLIATAEFDAARVAFECWPAIQQDSRARFALAQKALEAGERPFARSLVESYSLESDDRATWSSWMGGARLKYFRARLKIDGALVHEEAYSDLVGELAAGREQVWSLLADFDDIFPIISASPDWPAMWECLVEQLRATRENAIGRNFVVPSAPHNDDELFVELYRWALALSQFEVTRHVRVGALALVSVVGGPMLFTLLARALLEGEGDEPAEGLQLLTSDTSNVSSSELKIPVATLVDHPDYAVAAVASRLSTRWGQSVSMSPTDLPMFYRLDLGADDDEFEAPSLTDSASGAMRVEDPLGWTYIFSGVIQTLSRRGVSVAHIRHRCRMFIEQWGGIGAFGQGGTDALQAELHRLDMRMLFFRPHVRAAARAIRYVAGEMRRAELLGDKDEPWLLHDMGYHAVRLQPLSPAARPPFIRRPPADSPPWREGQERWLNDIQDDVRPLLRDGDSVIAEITQFTRREIRTELNMVRVRARVLNVEPGDDPESWAYKFPRAIWLEGVLPLTNEPAATIVRRLSLSQVPEIPGDMLVICPLWLSRLTWRRHPKNFLVYIDRLGQVVANVTWWRDGGPLDAGSDVVWGEGVFATVTREGRSQLEAEIGRLSIQVHASRTVIPEKDSESDQTERRAHAIE